MLILIRKAELEQALEAEVVKNQDDVKHLEDLEKHLKQRGKEYDVRLHNIQYSEADGHTAI